MRKYIAAILLLLAVSFPPQSAAVAITPTPVCKSPNWTVDRIYGQVRIFHKVGTGYPQFGVLYLNDSYLRLNYGPGSGWGTSAILMPSFWSGGVYYQGAKVSATCQFVNTLLVLTLKGTISTLSVTEKLTFSHPASTSMSVAVNASVVGTVPIDVKPGQAFKPVSLSSMHVSSTKWDARSACAGTQCFAIPAKGWIIPATKTVTSTNFRLLGGTSAWKVNAPTIVIQNLNAPRRITGWVTSSTNPNDDNIGYWAASSTLLPSWSYQIVARHP